MFLGLGATSALVFSCGEIEPRQVHPRIEGDMMRRADLIPTGRRQQWRLIGVIF
jgi:hypothetical protein